MVVELDFQKGLTRLTLADSIGENLHRPRRVRRALKKLRRALCLSLEQPLNVVLFTPEDRLGVFAVSALAADFEPMPNPNAPDLQTFAGLLKFLETFVGSPRSVVKENDTVKDLINHLNANEYGNVSAAIHKVGPILSMKINNFFKTLDTEGERPLPTEAKP